MGSILSGSISGSSSPDLELKNKTFKIHDQAYTLQRRLGGGAFGSVWSAVASNGRSAAIKTIDISGRRPGQDIDPIRLADSFQKEIQMAYKMRKDTRHVVTIYGFDFDMRSGLAFIAMELGGDTLATLVQKLHMKKDMQKRQQQRRDRAIVPFGDFIPSAERKNIWMQLSNIVQALHHYRVVHRDMKPDNLVFFGPVMKIVDLGIAKKEVRGFDPDAEPIGTPFYSAPECFQLGAPVTSKADIWSAGAILYHMTYGVEPRAGSYPPPPLPPTRSANVNSILSHCLQVNPHQRASHRWLASHPYTSDPRAF